MEFRDLKVGDTVTRVLAESVAMRLVISKVDDELIYCGGTDERAWMFDRTYGIEVDHDLRWGPQYGRTGSRLVMKKFCKQKHENEYEANYCTECGEALQ